MKALLLQINVNHFQTTAHSFIIFHIFCKSVTASLFELPPVFRYNDGASRVRLKEDLLTTCGPVKHLYVLVSKFIVKVAQNFGILLEIGCRPSD